jgi:hypothetical protein
MASMSGAVRDVRNFGARHLVSKPHPGSYHAKPKDLVSIGFRSARHRHTLLNQMLVNSDFHLRRPLRRAGCRSMSSRVRQRFDPQMAECGQLTSTLIAFFRTLSSISLPFTSSTQAITDGSQIMDEPERVSRVIRTYLRGPLGPFLSQSYSQVVLYPIVTLSGV